MYLVYRDGTNGMEARIRAAVASCYGERGRLPALVVPVPDSRRQLPPVTVDGEGVGNDLADLREEMEYYEEECEHRLEEEPVITFTGHRSRSG